MTIEQKKLPNSYFQFKQFKILQDKSAMKVCTDSCVFGAYIAGKIEDKTIHARRILDIGSGTGLLSLMLAQKATANIDAVEIEENAFLQTKENFTESKWKERLNAFHCDIKSWQSISKYDFIISNPPFFENNLKPGNKNKMLALHDHALDLKEVITAIAKRLLSTGTFALLLPFARVEYIKNLAEENRFYPEQILILKHSELHAPFRGILLFTQTKKPTTTKELVIRNENGAYTDAFNLLMKDYYL